MIRYTLRCERDHVFDSWFRDSQAFDDQSRDGLVECPSCGSRSVTKGLMAPSVVTSRRKAAPVLDPAPTPAAEPAPVALLDEKTQKLRALMREVRAHVMRTSDDVGGQFPDQARKMHEGLMEHRPIRGEASPDEVRALLEDGVQIMPVPNVPDDRN